MEPSGLIVRLHEGWVRRSRPSVKSKAKALPNRPLIPFIPWVPSFFPAHQAIGDSKLLFVDRRSRASQLQVLCDQRQRIHPEFVRKIFDCAHSKEAGLRLARRSHGPCAANIVKDRGVLIFLIWNFQNVR